MTVLQIEQILHDFEDPKIANLLNLKQVNFHVTSVILRQTVMCFWTFPILAAFLSNKMSRTLTILSTLVNKPGSDFGFGFCALRGLLKATPLHSNFPLCLKPFTIIYILFGCPKHYGRNIIFSPILDGSRRKLAGTWTMGP